MDLARAIGKFTTNHIYSWDSATASWKDTRRHGGLQVFDRFITERSFGQLKRILTVSKNHKLPTDITTIRVEGSEEVFLLEKFNEDVRYGQLYAYVYLLHEAPFLVDVKKITSTVNAAGVKIQTGEQVIETIWMDIQRFTGIASRTFEETEYTVVDMTFPRTSAVDTDCFVELSDGSRYNVDEVYSSLDLINARGKRVGL